jgi:hypothetical protein
LKDEAISTNESLELIKQVFQLDSKTHV